MDDVRVLTVYRRTLDFYGPRGSITLYFPRGTSWDQLNAYANELVEQLGGEEHIERKLMVPAIDQTSRVTLILSQRPFQSDGSPAKIGGLYNPDGFESLYGEDDIAAWYARVIQLTQPRAETLISGVIIEQRRNERKQLERSLISFNTQSPPEDKIGTYLQRFRRHPEVLRAQVTTDRDGAERVYISLVRKTLNHEWILATALAILADAGIAVYNRLHVRDTIHAVLPEYDGRPQPTMRQLAQRRRLFGARPHNWPSDRPI